MDTVLDKFGRVVIPKKMRDRLGWKAGDVLRAEDGAGSIVLEAKSDRLPLRRKGRLLVFTGEAVGDLTGAIQDLREGRLAALGRRNRK